MSGEGAPAGPHVGQLLRDALRRFEEDLFDGLEQAGAPRLRLPHASLLRYLDAGGTRASVLAERSALTRQAMTQLVGELEEMGMVARRPDPDDGRAKLVAYTEQGRAAFHASRSIIAGLEARYAAQLGERRYRALRAALEELAG